MGRREDAQRNGAGPAERRRTLPTDLFHGGAERGSRVPDVHVGKAAAGHQRDAAVDELVDEGDGGASVVARPKHQGRPHRDELQLRVPPHKVLGFPLRDDLGVVVRPGTNQGVRIRRVIADGGERRGARDRPAGRRVHHAAHALLPAEVRTRTRCDAARGRACEPGGSGRGRAGGRGRVEHSPSPDQV